MAEALGYYKATRIEKNKGRVPTSMLTQSYIVMSIIMCLIGALLVYTYTDDVTGLTARLAINIGASSPFIIGNLTKHDISSEVAT